MYGLIRKKRDGGELSRDEIRSFVEGYVAGEIPDYQVAAWLMAVYFRGLSDRETADLTQAMVDSGDTVDLSALPGLTVDKHSTGGVGDKTTLVLAPLLAAAGLTVAKMSGRGLGHTGGTLDKLEAIPGFRTDLSPEQMIAQVGRIGLAVIAQTGRLVPADGLLYALRDVTATVDSLPLIAASIMSKKLAAGAQAIILDVKTGAGAFMARPDDAFALASAMVAIGTAAGRSVQALITDMCQPLGFAVGNALEVIEAVATLRGEGPEDLRRVCLALGAKLLTACSNDSEEEVARTLHRLLADGSALERFRAFVAAQGGDPAGADRPAEILPGARAREVLLVEESGYVGAINALAVGDGVRALGAGRLKKSDVIDPAAGVVLHLKVGTRVHAGDPWATLHAADEVKLRQGKSLLELALKIVPELPEPPPLIHGTVDRLGRQTREAGI
ncbi:MAG: thymidine phosphorylase [Chloroflexota bacterium]